MADAFYLVAAIKRHPWAVPAGVALYAIFDPFMRAVFILLAALT